MVIFIEKITLKLNKRLEIIAEKIKPGGSSTNQATSYDIENTALHKTSKIIQIQQQETK